jgi:hypothetical protein
VTRAAAAIGGLAGARHIGRALAYMATMDGHLPV